MPTEPSSWESQNAGKAVRGFNAVREGLPRMEKEQGRGSEMVKRSQASLAEGPKPPGSLRHAVKARDFDRNWRDECRKAAAMAKTKPKRVYEDFTRSSNQGMSR